MRGRKNEISEMKHCSICSITKEREHFYNDRGARDGKRSSCITCDRSRENPEKMRQYREKNKDRLRLVNAQRYQRDKSLMVEQAKRRLTTPRGRTVQLVSSARQRAKKRSLSFNIATEHVQNIIAGGRCERSGLLFDLHPHRDVFRNPFAPSIDRVNNTEGYIVDNVQIVCNLYNTGKGEADELDFIAMCVAVAERHADDPAVIARLKELRGG